MEYVIGIDLGTSSLKGIAVNRAGEVIATKSADYQLIIDQVGYSEQNPSDWITAFDNVMLGLIEELPALKTDLVGISFSGQMHSLVLLDKDYKVIRNAILWNDVRTSKECAKIMKTFGSEILNIAKNRALEGFTLPKLLWIQENEPENFNKSEVFLLPKDYLRFYLTGKVNMEYSDAAGTLLLDIAKQEWSKEIAQQFNIPEKMLPSLVPSGVSIGNIKNELLQKYGIQSQVQVFPGGADNACAAVGAGVITPGTALVSIGTSGVLLSYEESADQDYQGNLHYFNHAEEHAYYSMGVTLSAGSSLNWFANICGSENDFDNLLTGLDQVPIGSEGLLFTPYLMGERNPHFDSQIRGSFIGLDRRHERIHLARAVLEGITFSLKDSQVMMEKVANRSFKQIISTGGGAKNANWLQMQADIFNAEILTITSEEGPALGAAMLAAVGVNWFNNLAECAKVFVKIKSSYQPLASSVARYEQLYQIYTQAYPATQKISRELLAFQA